MMKLKYSPSIAWANAASAVGMPWSAASGVTASALHMNAILPYWVCQNFGATIGPTAIESNRPMNGSAHGHGSASSLSAAAFAGAMLPASTAPAASALHPIFDGVDIGKIPLKLIAGP